MENKRKVSYYYDSDVGDYYYGMSHPMKPHRVRMAHDLIVRYGLYKQLQVYKPLHATLDDMAAFHHRDYLEYLTVADRGGDRATANASLKAKFNLKGDCPVFEGVFRYCQSYVGASLGGAVQLNHGQADTVINWAGGLHHAKTNQAAGFCYVNDIVLAILELLKYHKRVLYIDIDIHHGDGVEEAFFDTDRVLTVSFHKYGDDFFPGTGGPEEVGVDTGKYYAVNVPLDDGMDDASFAFLFEPIMEEVVARYRPEAIVLQSGADSLTGDRLGRFNLTIKGHAACHKFMMKFGLPMLVVGGGGYKIKNVARCWAYETAVLLGVEASVPDDLPPNEYYEYFKPDYKLHLTPDATLKNRNDQGSLARVLRTVLDNLRHIRPAPAGPEQLPGPAGAAQQQLEKAAEAGRRRAEGDARASDQADGMDVDR
ncbi:histone deacetylase [Raphidocelis subcapitata]|uniref:Histone deacetylase n=1 Tax=Raphidocelis subcapitata TaxID=307507 RepID=A0A2V0P6L2_9CHLO|nr:histone deacetylase [Raphidocelis subcapitata]|eukprot:GBF93503.1 histone deacetylase [Raphidocelis subcapitata]